MRNVYHTSIFFINFFFSLTLTFQLLDRPWSQVSSLPPGTCLQFLSRIGFSIPTARRLPSNVANSPFRAFRDSICAQEKVSTEKLSSVLGEKRAYLGRPQSQKVTFSNSRC